MELNGKNVRIYTQYLQFKKKNYVIILNVVANYGNVARIAYNRKAVERQETEFKLSGKYMEIIDTHLLTRDCKGYQIN